LGQSLFATCSELIDDFIGIGIILYCGAGLGSTMNALALHLIGYDNVAVYDGSLNEWGRYPSLPMERG
jgi:thiosulfate/3-mercaptopyruvate sulfurtransferase